MGFRIRRSMELFIWWRRRKATFKEKDLAEYNLKLEFDSNIREIKYYKNYIFKVIII